MIQQTNDYVGTVRDFLAAHRDMEVHKAQHALSEATALGDDQRRRMYEDRLRRLREIQIV